MIHVPLQPALPTRSAVRRYVALAFATACAANVAAVHAQGAVPQTAPATAAGATVEVRSFEVRGVTRFEHEQIDAVLRPFTGRALTPAQIGEAAAALTAHYRKAGYFVAQAFVPPQSVGGGNVVLEVYEGRLEKDGIDVSGSNERVRNDVVRGILEAALTSEPVIRIGEYERGLLLATDLPGISVQSTLAPGSEPGTGRLRAQVIDEPAWSGQVEADNSGYEDLGKYRIGGTLTLNSPTGVGDQLSARLLTAGSGANNASLSYSRPVGSYGTRVGASLDAYVYAYDNITGLGRATGDARDVRLFASHPLVRARHFNLRLNGDYSYSRYNDTNDTGPTSLRNINLLTIGVAADDDVPYLGLLGQGDLALAVSAVPVAVPPLPPQPQVAAAEPPAPAPMLVPMAVPQPRPAVPTATPNLVPSATPQPAPTVPVAVPPLPPQPQVAAAEPPTPTPMLVPQPTPQRTPVVPGAVPSFAPEAPQTSQTQGAVAGNSAASAASRQAAAASAARGAVAANACPDTAGPGSPVSVEVYRGRSSALIDCRAVSAPTAQEFNLAVVGIRAPAYAQ